MQDSNKFYLPRRIIFARRHFNLIKVGCFMCARCKALWRCRPSPTSTPVFPPYFQNRMHWNRVVYPWGSAWNGSLWPSAERHASAPLSDTNTMAVNPNFFPNGYQDPMHPEDEVVTNWVRVVSALLNPAFAPITSCNWKQYKIQMWIVIDVILRHQFNQNALTQSKFGALEGGVPCYKICDVITRELYAVIFRNEGRAWICLRINLIGLAEVVRRLRNLMWKYSYL